MTGRENPLPHLRRDDDRVSTLRKATRLQLAELIVDTMVALNRMKL